MKLKNLGLILDIITILITAFVLVLSFNIYKGVKASPPSTQIFSNNIIVIDPGHGGIDGGAVSKKGTVEKHLNLSISLKLRDKLKALGYMVLMTRDDDIGLYTEGQNINNLKLEDLNNRCKIKRDSSGIFFISIHQNFFRQSNCFGPQVWYSNNPESMKLAHIIQENFNRDLGFSLRKEKSAEGMYKVLRCYPYIPSIIIECGFLTNPEEEEKLKDEGYQNKIVNLIARSIKEYFQLN